MKGAACVNEVVCDSRFSCEARNDKLGSFLMRGALQYKFPTLFREGTPNEISFESFSNNICHTYSTIPGDFFKVLVQFITNSHLKIHDGLLL